MVVLLIRLAALVFLTSAYFTIILRGCTKDSPASLFWTCGYPSSAFSNEDQRYLKILKGDKTAHCTVINKVYFSSIRNLSQQAI